VIALAARDKEVDGCHRVGGGQKCRRQEQSGRPLKEFTALHEKYLPFGREPQASALA